MEFFIQDACKGGAIAKEIGQDTYQQLLQMLKDKSSDCVVTKSMDKETRTKVHQWIKLEFNGKLDSKTVDESIQIFISKGKPQRRAKFYTMFHLYKENKETLYSFNLIAKLLRYFDYLIVVFLLNH